MKREEAKRMRRDMTPAEAILWHHLRLRPAFGGRRR
jgi:very-short-patch-repair endonuclease